MSLYPIKTEMINNKMQFAVYDSDDDTIEIVNYKDWKDWALTHGWTIRTSGNKMYFVFESKDVFGISFIFVKNKVTYHTASLSPIRTGFMYEFSDGFYRIGKQLIYFSPSDLFLSEPSINFNGGKPYIKINVQSQDDDGHDYKDSVILELDKNNKIKPTSELIFEDYLGAFIYEESEFQDYVLEDLRDSIFFDEIVPYIRDKELKKRLLLGVGGR